MPTGTRKEVTPTRFPKGEKGMAKGRRVRATGGGQRGEGKGKREEEGNSSGRIGGRFVFVIE